ncbi:MAG: 1-(5-phosphoribosyl)-5-[(5-phosphoribosylamino)methylideneamino]imidazole-4-carboxamide isomerase [Deltaproteobacteria bacterium]|nr:1-(5-phosphoribosyl)-5-[(5-phosphoribosylamino)methylideneamino]imidazole-4-carboxamide isomerase [Deltaproteobacteria bacterium]
MLIIPAIDIKDGKCVRLEQGDFSRVTQYGDDPMEMALYWQNQGAERLHVVDLDGSLKGTPVNAEAIKKIAATLEIPVQVGGGIRNIEAATSYLAAGIDAIIIGTSALRDPALVRQLCEEFGKKIFIGIDARKGMVALSGWTETSRVGAVDLARQLEVLGIGAIIYTDISRDGMQTGVNVHATRELARALKTPVIASGGLGSLADVEALMTHGDEGIIGVIAGRALYTKAVSLPMALDLIAKMGDKR